ncbi:group 1 glycosyl transferase [Candidatus Omnitrophus magneticus]|uniref:Group 1 glycosyl transferase n=1 Tax=Candidatus Omnitrophus magneticus TaxID=1609969 RepID=A0A0F0CRJ2_9BACT|nr:group 1 glycosyl transferase [Candidatus Omnitrophus magneticus]
MKKIAMVVFSYYPSDPRVRRSAEALVEEGIMVDVICLRANNESKEETFNGVNVYRLPIERKRGAKVQYLREYATFIIMSSLKLAWLHAKRGYHIVHIHNMPDILVLCAIIPKLTGAKVILDLHDPMPEVYMTKYSLPYTHPVIKILLLLEKFSIRIANLVLTPNIAFKTLFTSRSCDDEKVKIIMNSPQESIFGDSIDSTLDQTKNDQFVIMYHGTIVERHGLDTALDALTLIGDKIPNIILNVYGDGDFRGQFIEKVKKQNLTNVVKYHGHVSLETIADAIKHTDVGLIPNKMTTFTEINLPTRIFEYLCMGKPVIAPKTRGITDYFDDESIFFFNSGDISKTGIKRESESTSSLADTILQVYQNPSKRQAVLKAGIVVYNKHRWKLQKSYLVEIVKELFSKSKLRRFRSGRK